jgi:hypothetical protein
MGQDVDMNKKEMDMLEKVFAAEIVGEYYGF